MTTPNGPTGEPKKKRLSFRQKFRMTLEAVKKYTPEQHIDVMVKAKLMTPEFGESEKRRLAARDAAKAATDATAPAADAQPGLAPPAAAP